jgi:hypothetical protein
MKDPIELERVRIMLRSLAYQAQIPYETGFVSAVYKRQLVEMKWFIEDLLEDIGTFAGEEEWEQERLIQLLKRKENPNA